MYALGATLLVVATGAAAALVPKWALPLVMVVAFFALMLLPSVLVFVVNPMHIRSIRSHLEGLGASDIEIRAFPNHYGARFSVGGKKYYAKCLVIRSGTFKWKGKAPEELLRGAGVA